MKIPDPNCCKNPKCKNFGVSIQSKFSKGDVGYSFKYQDKAKKDIKGYECRYCGMSSTQILSQHSLLSTYSYYLSLSFPFASCSNKACENHHINLFESFKKENNAKPSYRAIGEYRALCKRCNTTFYIGAAKKISHTTQTNDLLSDLYLRVISKNGVSQSIESLREYNIDPKKYYSHLSTLASTLRDYQSFQLTKLLSRKSNADETAFIYTDVMDISLQRRGDGQRETHLYLFVTVLRLEESYFILALHSTLR